MKVLITGASSGIGKDLALELINKFDSFILVGRNLTRLDEVKNKLLSINNKLNVEVISVDLKERDKCEELFNNHKDVDLLINNAGFGDYGKFDETRLDKDLMMLDTNIISLHILTKLYYKEMVKNNNGHILNVASIAAFTPGPLMSTYYASKAYVLRLSEGLREELRRNKSKVKISVLCPGPVKTNFENAANVKFNFKGVSSKYIAHYTVKHLNKFYIVPQFKIRLARFAMSILSSRRTSRIIYGIQNKRNKK